MVFYDAVFFNTNSHQVIYFTICSGDDIDYFDFIFTLYKDISSFAYKDFSLKEKITKDSRFTNNKEIIKDSVSLFNTDSKNGSCETIPENGWFELNNKDVKNIKYQVSRKHYASQLEVAINNI